MRLSMDPNQVFSILRERITLLELAPGSILNLSELAQDFGMSRTPIKEALILLQADEWVQRKGSHFMVTPLSIDRIKDITEIRTVMELQANLWAMERASESELAELGKIITEIDRTNNKASLTRLLEIDLKFHRIIYKATKNNQILQILQRLLGHYSRFWLSLRVDVDRNSCFIETLDIIEAIQEKNEAKLKTATSEHIKKSLQAIMGSYL